MPDTDERAQIIKVPLDLLQKFQEEPRVVVGGIKNGLLLLPDAILDKIGFGKLSEKGMAVILVNRANAGLGK